jgi:sporulation protein YlmC with PRC-barrel domain
MTPHVLSASTITGDGVVNRAEENLGKIEDLVVDIDSGRIAYAVLSFGGFLGMGDKLFALPWNSLELDSANRRFILDVPKETLESAPGFDKDQWPNMADRTWATSIYSHYNQEPYWNN